MDRKYIDCREFPSESHCTIAISADSEDEVVNALVKVYDGATAEPVVTHVH